MTRVAVMGLVIVGHFVVFVHLWSFYVHATASRTRGRGTYLTLSRPLLS